MDCAFDIGSGKIVAADAGNPSRAYRCDVCHSRVVLRGYGPFAQRRMHFAHVKNQARPDCGNYYPSYGSTLPGAKTGQGQPGISISRPRVHVGEPELYLKETSSGFDLKLVIPGRPSEPEWNGTVLIQGRFGEQSVGFTSLHRPFEASVLPLRERYMFAKRGEVGALFWAMLRDGIQGLKYGANCFRQSEVRGRRLGPTERMFWGDEYWVICPEAVEASGGISRYLSLRGIVAGWNVFDLELPSKPEYVPNFEREDIQDWLGHAIHERAARARFVDLLPHHIDEQGLFVLSTPVSTLRVVLDGWDKNVFVLDSNGSDLVWQRATDDVLVISPCDASDAFVYVDGVIVLAMRFEACELFSPRGPQLKINDRGVELFAKEAHEMLCDFRESRETSSEIVLEACNERVQKLIRLNGAYLDSQEALQSALGDHDHPFEMDASNFGRVCLPNLKKITVAQVLAPLIRNRGKWLLSLPYPSPGEPSCRFPGENGIKTPEWVKSLRARNWNVAFGPHLRALACELRKTGNL